VGEASAFAASASAVVSRLGRYAASATISLLAFSTVASSHAISSAVSGTSSVGAAPSKQS